MFKFFSQKNKKETKRDNTINKNKFFDRSALLSKITKASEWTTADDKNNYDVIKENLKFLKSDLKLVGLHNELMIIENETNKEKNLSGALNGRQMNCMLMINFNIQEKNVQGAYHELYDFIQSYNDIKDKPIDIVERIIINNSVIQIESILK